LSLLVSECINGLVLASFYALVAIGLVLIFGVVGIVNFAHGDFVMVGGYFLYQLLTVAGLPYLLAIPVTVVAAGALGVVIFVVALRHLMGRPWYAQLVATIALSILMENIAQAIWSPSAVSVATPFDLDAIHIGTVANISVQQVFVFAGTVLALAGMWALINRTRTGKSMRAVSLNRIACEIVGIDVRRVGMLAFAIGTALCGVAAVLVLPLQNVYPTVGLSITTQAFVIVILGGMRSMRGAIFAAVIIGMVEALSAGYISSAYTDAFGYGVMIIVLVVHPTGLFGRRDLAVWSGL
jgi:branched-chain amino acid transport system permease protein